jgi:hypothetical protein
VQSGGFLAQLGLAQLGARGLNLSGGLAAPALFFRLQLVAPLQGIAATLQGL